MASCMGNGKSIGVGVICSSFCSYVPTRDKYKSTFPKTQLIVNLPSFFCFDIS